MDPGPDLTLLLIVRDEAGLTGRLLREHRDLWDEAVVVDTGSRDDTPARAAAAGARVLHFAWRDDFAAARNRGLEAARGRWILALDADEAIAPEDFPRLRRALAAPPDRCYSLPQLNYTWRTAHPEWRPVAGRYPAREAGLPGYVETRITRLLPARDGLRYRGRVHESVEPAALALGLAVEALDVPVHHYGHVRERRVLARRDDLYGRLVRLKLAEQPDDPAAGLEMAVRLLEEGGRGEARSRLAALATAAPAEVAARAGLLLGRMLRRDGDREAAARVLRAALRRKPGWLFCWRELAAVLVESGRWRLASVCLAEGLRLFGPDPLLLAERVRLLVATGRPEAAAETARGLARACPTWPEAAALAGRCDRLASGLVARRQRPGPERRSEPPGSIPGAP